MNELCANVSLLLVIVHILGVAVESFIHKENLAKTIVRGNKMPLD